MRKTLLFFCISGHLTVAAQQLVFREEVGFKKLNNIEAAVSGNIIIAKAEVDDGTIFCAIDMENNSLEKYEIKRQSTSITIAGVTTMQGEISIYLTSDYYGMERLECLTFSKTLKKFSKLKEIRSTFNKDHLCFMNDNNTFYSLSFDKRKHMLALLSYNAGYLKDTIAFDISDERIVKSFDKKGLLTNKVKPFTFIMKGLEISFDQAKSQNKVYLSDGKLLIVSDEWVGEELGETLILKVDLATQDVKPQLIRLPYANKTDHNSFISNDKLFVLGIDKTMIDLTIFDINLLEKLEKYRYLKGEPVQFKHSNLERNGLVVESEQDGGSDKRSIAKSVHKSLKKGQPVISVTSVDAVYKLLIGSYAVSKGGSGGMTMMTSGGGSISTPRGTVSTPATTQMVPSGISTSSSESKTYFYGCLRKSDLGIINEYHPLDHGVFYKIEKRIIELDKKIKLGGNGIINSTEGAYLIYMDKQKRTMIIEKFIR